MFPSFFSALLTCTLTLPALASANPDLLVIRDPTTLSFSRLLNELTNGQTLHHRDVLRAQSFKAHGDFQKGSEPSKRAEISTPADNRVVSYVASVGVGSPPTQYSLIIDTGSSNTWVGASKPYAKTETSVDTGDAVAVGYGAKYGSGFFNGSLPFSLPHCLLFRNPFTSQAKNTEYLDTVTIGPGLKIKNQSIGVAENDSKGYGILRIGPQGLTINTLPSYPNEPIPTVTDNLFTARTISSRSVSISFAPFDNDSTTTGEITWGGVDTSKFFGLAVVPITKTAPSRNYWGIDGSIEYGGLLGSHTILPQTAGILDTGTTLLLIARDTFQEYEHATKAVFDPAVGLLSITPENFSNLYTLGFKIGGTVFELPRDAQRWPGALNTYISGKPDGIYLIVGDIGYYSGEGLDFILRQVWLERFYSVYDSENKEVGIAYTRNNPW